MQRYDQYRGANIMRIDHFNCQVPDVQLAYDWWTKEMGFYLSEYTVTDHEPESLWAAWLPNIFFAFWSLAALRGSSCLGPS